MNGNQIADILVSKIAIYAEANGTSILQAFDDEADALIEYINEVEEVYKPADFKARLTNFVIGKAPLYATDKDYIARFFNAEPVELDEALRGKLAELQACLRKRISKNKRKPAAPESKESEPPKRTPKELAFIDTLDQVDTELRKARQVMHEFYDDIVVCESRYPTFEGIVKSEDGGRSWHHTLSWQSQGNQKVLYDPSSAQRAYAFSEEMADWNLYETTVFRTSDGGNTWETIFHNIISGKPDYMMLHDNRLYLTSTMIDYGDGIRSSGFYSIPTDGSATSISHMTEGLHHSSAEAYDLQGRRLTGTSSKGIYIRNGKKYINF